MTTKNCAFCKSSLNHTFVNLGMAPMVSAYLSDNQLNDMEPFFPLHAFVCEECKLVQLPQAKTPSEIFGNYPYFSSMSSSWLKHASDYVSMAVDRFNLTTDSKVIEIASNDGYLLQYFMKQGVGVLGIEPAANVAAVAVENGIPTVSKFFGKTTATEIVNSHAKADLIVGNNVLAHVPDISDFVSGMQVMLKASGVITVEFPHLLKTIKENQFDQVFHEHFSYLSLIAVNAIFSSYNLQIFDVQEVPTHGGSIRVFAQHEGSGSRKVEASVALMFEKENLAGLGGLKTYLDFSQRAVSTKHKLLAMLIELKSSGKSIVGYGAPGKGCVMLNYCGIRDDILDYLVDISPTKQGLSMPGVRLPINHPDKIKDTRPDFVLILPWNLSAEIINQLEFIREWGGQFIIPIPEAQIV